MRYMLFAILPVLAFAQARGAEPKCSEKVTIAVEDKLNSSPGVDPKDPYYKAGRAKIVSEENGIQVWSVPFNLGVDGGGKFEIGVVTQGEGSSACTLVSGFEYVHNRLRKFKL